MAKTMNKQIENEIEILPEGTPVQDTITLPIDRKHPDLRWEKIGTIVYPLNMQTKYGKVYDNGELKAIMQNNFCTKIVNRKYFVLPNEAIDPVVNEFVDNPVNGLRLMDVKETKHGQNKYWILIDDKHQFKVQNSFEENDTINFGAIIRNSVGGRLAFGVDLFSFRSICMNGAIFGYKGYGSFSVRHFGTNFEKMTDHVFRGLRDQLGHASEMINYYNKFASTKLGNNKALIERLANDISLKYLPDDIIVKLPNKSKGQKREFTIKKALQDKSLWFLFNELTSKLWSLKHETKLSFDMVRQNTMKLHEILVDEVAPRKIDREPVISDRKRWFRG